VLLGIAPRAYTILNKLLLLLSLLGIASRLKKSKETPRVPRFRISSSTSSAALDHDPEEEESRLIMLKRSVQLAVAWRRRRPVDGRLDRAWARSSTSDVAADDAVLFVFLLSHNIIQYN
jgi:hypothetical protein